MAIFEAGIITKMTENEYENLGKQKKEQNNAVPDVELGTSKKQTRRAARASEDNEKLKPISLKMLQGAFYLLCIGNIFSGLILLIEIAFYKHSKKYKNTKKKRCAKLRIGWNYLVGLKRRFVAFIRRTYRNMMHEAYVATLEYIE